MSDSSKSGVPFARETELAHRVNKSWLSADDSESVSHAAKLQASSDAIAKHAAEKASRILIREIRHYLDHQEPRGPRKQRPGFIRIVQWLICLFYFFLQVLVVWGVGTGEFDGKDGLVAITGLQFGLLGYSAAMLEDLSNNKCEIVIQVGVLVLGILCFIMSLFKLFRIVLHI